MPVPPATSSNVPGRGTKLSDRRRRRFGPLLPASGGVVAGGSTG